MKYFILEAMPDYTDAPFVQDWYSKIDIRDISPQGFWKLADRTLFKVAPNQNMVFADILMSPFFMVTIEMKRVLEMYDTHIRTKQAVLLDSESGLSEVYYIPLLKVVDCLSPKSQLNIDRSIIKKAVLQLDKIKDVAIFKIGGVKSTYIAARMDVVESLLRRSPRGISLTAVSTE